MNEVWRITLTGMLIVFSGLAITSLVIYIFSEILNRGVERHVHITIRKPNLDKDLDDLNVVIAAAVSAVLGESWRVTKVKRVERTRHLSRWKRMEYEVWSVKRRNKVSAID